MSGRQVSRVTNAELLPRQPLRYLLADDQGAGKTIMAGLLIKELIIRGDLERCLIVAPGNLFEQGQDELEGKFALEFELLSREQIETSVTGNPFIECDRLIVRLDMASRSETPQAKPTAAADWALVIVDEAHRMAANPLGSEIKYTKRYKLGQFVGSARHFLLMTATPHNGDSWCAGWAMARKFQGARARRQRDQRSRPGSDRRPTVLRNGNRPRRPVDVAAA
jgi:SNF2 family DNA or RNA helicase